MIKYARDEVADEVVASDEKIQQAIKGTIILLIVPGHAAHVGVMLGLILAWMGPSLSAFLMLVRRPQDVVYYFLASAVFVVIVGYCAYALLAGLRRARTRMFRLALALSTMGVGVLALAVMRDEQPAIVLACGGTLAGALASRGIAGASYALCAAFFRAKRAHVDRTNAETQALRARHRA